MVHEVTNSKVKYKIRGECNIIIDTETSMNKVDDDMNYLVKYMIKGEYNIVSVTETSMNKVDDDMNSLVNDRFKVETIISLTLRLPSTRLMWT